MRTPGEDSQRSLRAVGGLICPRCRTKGEYVPRPDGKLPRCVTCSFALVSADALADADGDPFLGTTIAGRFVVTGRLGAGSMGTVYRARQEAMGRDVAIKILRSDRAFDAQAKARFTREARAMSLLASPHTVTVFDFGEIPEVDQQGAGSAAPSVGADDLGRGASLYLAMELLEGESLGGRLKRLKRLPFEQAVRIACHTLLSLAEAHEKGVIHRDHKPDNLFLATGAGEEIETCKVLDFGIAKVVSDAPAVDALETQAGTVFGTPRYMSPEQAQGKPLDARSDLYSLAVLLYQMLVGRPPFVDDDAVVVDGAPHQDAARRAQRRRARARHPRRALRPRRPRARQRPERSAGLRPRAHRFEPRRRGRASAPSDRPRAESGATASGQIPALSRDDLDPPNTKLCAAAVGRSPRWPSASRSPPRRGRRRRRARRSLPRPGRGPGPRRGRRRAPRSVADDRGAASRRARNRRLRGRSVRRYRRRAERGRLRLPLSAASTPAPPPMKHGPKAQLPPLRSVTRARRFQGVRDHRRALAHHGVILEAAPRVDVAKAVRSPRRCTGRTDGYRPCAGGPTAVRRSPT